MSEDIALGPFTCDVTLSRVSQPEFVREEKDGVTYLSASGYELAYETTLIFDGGGRLPIKAKVLGEGASLMVMRNASGEPTRMRGWVKGSIQIMDEHEQTIFRGTYNDVKVEITLTGDEQLTPTGQKLEHWESGFGEGQYLGHFFSIRAELTRESGALEGKAQGSIE